MDEATGRVARHAVEVAGVTDLTPWYRRVTFVGRGLLARLDLAPAAPLVIHCPGPDGPVQRSYTLAQADVAADRFALDFVLHDPPGPAAAWAARARPGLELEVTDPPHRLVWPDPMSRAVLIGDTSAAAALESLRRRLPAGVASTVLLVDPHPDLDRVPPRGDVLRLPLLRDEDLAAIDLDPATDWLWAAGERDLVKRLRAHARDHWRLPRQRAHLQTYWIARP